MSETKHTPGPWRTTSFLGDFTVVNIDGVHITEVSGRGYGHDAAHDAHLIAAAPEMLHALQWLVEAADGPPLSDRDRASTIYAATELARAAIKKAQGEK